MKLHGLSPDERERLTSSGLKAFFSISVLWKLDEPEQADLLGLNGGPSLRRWQVRPPRRLGRDRLERISHVLGIYKALQLLLPTAEQANAWVKKPNDAPPFLGAAALDLMRQGIPGLYAVRSYLEVTMSSLSIDPRIGGTVVATRVTGENA